MEFRSRPAMPRLAILLLFAAAAAAGAGAARGDETPWRLVAQGGQAISSKAVPFAEFAGVALARDVRVWRRIGGTAELYPYMGFDQSREDRAARERVGASALALNLTFELPLLPLVGLPFLLRLEGGTGVFYGWQDAVPAQGSRFNFFNQGGVRLRWVMPASDWGISAGYRWVHVSNGGFLGTPNPGLSFHSLVLAWDLPRSRTAALRVGE